jgi:hypothetical protein
MKKIISIAIISVGLAATSSVMAEGSEVTQSTLINATANTNALNAAIGKGAKANLGSIAIEGSKVSQSTVINASANTNVLNAAIGEDAEANTGSVSIK